MKNLGPPGFSLSPPGKVDCWYAAAVRDCRLIHTGTVKVTIVNAHETRQFTLVIADASSPPLPSPACLRPGTIRTADANDGGPPWMAMCMKLGAVLPDHGSTYAAGIELAGDATLEHGGGWEGFRTAFQVSPDRRTAIAVTCNAGHLANTSAVLATQLRKIWT